MCAHYVWQRKQLLLTGNSLQCCDDRELREEYGNSDLFVIHQKLTQGQQTITLNKAANKESSGSPQTVAV